MPLTYERMCSSVDSVHWRASSRRGSASRTSDEAVGVGRRLAPLGDDLQEVVGEAAVVRVLLAGGGFCVSSTKTTRRPRWR